MTNDIGGEGDFAAEIAGRPPKPPQNYSTRRSNGSVSEIRRARIRQLYVFHRDTLSNLSWPDALVRPGGAAGRVCYAGRTETPVGAFDWRLENPLAGVGAL